MATREQLAERGYSYVETQAGVDMYSRPEDDIIWPNLFHDPKTNVVIVKSTATGLEDEMSLDLVLETIPPTNA